MFDFSKPFNKLNDHEKNVFLFGFNEYKFLKPKGKATTLGDYLQWNGLYSLIYDNLSKIHIRKKIKKSKHDQICPFCSKGFKKEVRYYTVYSKSILEYV